MSGLPALLGAGTELTVVAPPWAPGFRVAFGRWRGALPAIAPLATGKGRSAEAAIAGCLGEMAENLSLGAPAAPVRAVPFHGAASARDARVRDLADPADPGSEGAAAHPDPAEARLRALCERVERAALAGWWAGGAAGAALPAAGDVAGGLRGANPAGRRSLAWRLPAPAGIAAVLALSDDGGGGRIALGTAAALDEAGALEAALAEALLAEIALLAPPAHPDRRRAEDRAPLLARRWAGLVTRGAPMAAAPPLDRAPLLPPDRPPPAGPTPSPDRPSLAIPSHPPDPSPLALALPVGPPLSARLDGPLPEVAPWAAMPPADFPGGLVPGASPAAMARLARAVGALRAAGVAGGFADLTHPALGLPVVRCLCPDLPSARGVL